MSNTSHSHTNPPLRLGILLSGRGRGTNMANLVAATRDGRLEAEVVLVVSTTRDAPALERARALGTPILLIPADEYPDAGALDRALADAFARARVDLVCLAGYMRLLGTEFLNRFPNRVLNIHPALLPRFGGQGLYGHHVHEAVLASGEKVSGATVHLVDAEYDHGPILLQEEVPVLPDDTPETLAARVLAAEHRVYPAAIQRYARRGFHPERFREDTGGASR
ncbi:MAG: phosphoribosylglycinamide formyltransferase [Armatimonadetes bacterium]|nr:phosphoribosylglycinamide formyltransferase [Armatimonadota bacterium]